MDFDLNEVGRQGYKMLQQMHIIGEKDKQDLTLKEREEVINNLYNHLNMSILKCRETLSHKHEFLSYLIICVICFLDNTDLNKYVKVTEKN